MSQLGGSIDKLNVNVLELFTGGNLDQGLAQDQGTLLDTDNGTLQHQPIFLDFIIVFARRGIRPNSEFHLAEVSSPSDV